MNKLEHLAQTHTEPQNLEAEQSVLGACLLDNSKILRLHEWMESTDFFRNSHRQIYSAMFDLAEQGTQVDLLTLATELDQRKQLNAIGGPAYLAALVDIVPTAANIESHAKLVHDTAVERDLLRGSIHTVQKIYEGKTPLAEVLDFATKAVFAAAERTMVKPVTKLSEVLHTVYQDIELIASHEKEAPGLLTGFYQLDRMLSGLQPSDLIIVAGATSSGKTALTLNIAENLTLQRHVPTAYFSIEMKKEQLALRLLSSQARINAMRLRAGDIRGDDEWTRLAQKAEILSRVPLYIDEASTLTPLELRAKARRLKVEHDIQCIVVDYLQILSPGVTMGTREQEVTYLARQLKALAKELDVPVIAPSQLSRKVDNRSDPKPKLGDLRESGAIEHEADVVLFLYRPEMYGLGSEGQAEVIIAKQRSGPLGDIKLAFLKEYTRFENLDRHHEERPF